MRRNYGLSPPLVAGAVDIAGLALPAPVVPVVPPSMLPLLMVLPWCMVPMLPIALPCIIVWWRVIL